MPHGWVFFGTLTVTALCAAGEIKPDGELTPWWLYVLAALVLLATCEVQRETASEREVRQQRDHLKQIVTLEHTKLPRGWGSFGGPITGGNSPSKEFVAREVDRRMEAWMRERRPLVKAVSPDEQRQQINARRLEAGLPTLDELEERKRVRQASERTRRRP